MFLSVEYNREHSDEVWQFPLYKYNPGMNFNHVISQFHKV